MVKPWTALGLLVAAVATSACDTTQPTGTGPQNASLSFATTVVDAPAVHVYEEWQDILPFPNGDGVPESPVTDPYDPDGDGPLPSGRVQRYSCETDTSGASTATSVPWPYRTEVRLLRAGSTESVTLDSNFGSAQAELSLTDYDTATTDELAAPDAPPRSPSGTTHYLNGKTFPAGSRFYVERCVAVPGNRPVPRPNVLGAIGAFRFDLNPGDTVLVDIIKEPAVRALVPELPSPNIIGTLTVGGQRVPLSGTASTGTEDAGKASFSYTSN